MKVTAREERGKAGKYFIAEYQREGFKEVDVHFIKFYWKIKKVRAEEAHGIGKRAVIMRVLSKSGFNEVWGWKGGIKEWTESGKADEDASAQGSLKRLRKGQRKE